MQALIEDFLFYLRHERGQSEQTQKTYSALLGRFVQWAGERGVSDWKAVTLSHLMEFITQERKRHDGPNSAVSILAAIFAHAWYIAFDITRIEG